MDSSFLRIFSKVKKIRYAFHLGVQYFIDFVIPNGIKDKRINEINTKEWQKSLVKAKPVLELLQANNKKRKIVHKAIKIIDHRFVLFGKEFSFHPGQRLHLVRIKKLTGIKILQQEVNFLKKTGID